MKIKSFFCDITIKHFKTSLLNFMDVGALSSRIRYPQKNFAFIHKNGTFPQVAI